MSKVAVATDSSSGITQAQASELGLYVLPMPFYIDDEVYYEEVNLTQEDFYRKLEKEAKISTSMPAVGEVMDLWNRLLEDHDEVVYIPMSRGLSGSCQTARMLAEDSEEFAGKVFVADNQRISVTQRQSACEAVAMARAGMSGQQICEVLEQTGRDSSIYITVETLKYLKRGGRITPAAAALGTLLRIKPVLQIQGEKLDAFAKCRTMGQGRTLMIEAIRKDLDERFHLQEEPWKCQIDGAYTCSAQEAEEWKQQIEAAFPGHTVQMDPLPLVIACHIGPGSMAVTITKKVELSENN